MIKQQLLKEGARRPRTLISSAPSASAPQRERCRGGRARLLYITGTGATPFPEEVPFRHTSMSQHWKDVLRRLIPEIIFTPIGPAVPIPTHPRPKPQAHFSPHPNNSDSILSFRLNDLIPSAPADAAEIHVDQLKPRSRFAVISYAREAIRRRIATATATATATVKGEGAGTSLSPSLEGKGEGGAACRPPIYMRRDGVYVPVLLGRRRILVRVPWGTASPRTASTREERRVKPLPPPPNPEWAWQQFTSRFPKYRERLESLKTEIRPLLDRGLSVFDIYKALYPREPSLRIVEWVVDAMQGYVPDELARRYH